MCQIRIRLIQPIQKSIEEMSYIVKNYAAANGCVVMASGETDIISDGKEVYHISNGSSRMADVTGTGCILNCITAVFMSVTDALTALWMLCSSSA